jgi:4-amino-4-deoxy-L-arabinose transferase-like glycosyltransferase
VPRRQLITLGAILVLAAVLRGYFNDVSEYSPADERVYTENTRALVLDGWWQGYPKLVDHFLTDQSRWLYPPPLRYGYYALTSAACQVDSRCNQRTLAWLSTLAGIAAVLLAYFLGKKLASSEVGLVAATLTLTSPLQLAMGRRALQDELFCAATLLALLLAVPIFIDGVERASWRRYAAVIAALAFLFSLKETAVLLWPALTVLLIVAVRRRGWIRADLALLIVPPILYVVGFAAVAHGVDDFFRVASITTSNLVNPYGAQYQAGPPHRIALDLFILAPLVCLVAVAGAGVLLRRPEESHAWLLIGLTLLLALGFSLAPLKNVRFAITVDPLLRIVAAWTCVSLLGPRRVWMAVAANAACELAVFYAIFIEAKVYDPVTANLLRALKVIP